MSTLLLIAGETSGDQHAATLISETKAVHSNLNFIGIAGQQSEQQGMQLLAHYHKLNVMGVTAVFAKSLQILKCYQLIHQALKDHKPICVVLIDFAGFNLKIAKLAKRYSIPVFYYIPPKIWAWQYKRIKKIKRFVDQVACIFPFEQAIYKKENIPSTVVINPLMQHLQSYEPNPVIKPMKSPKSEWTITIIPGSRPNEIKYILPELLKAAQRLNDLYNIKWTLPLAPGSNPSSLTKALEAVPFNIELIDSDKRYDAYRSADIALACSGTVTLELSLLNTPMVVVYKVSAPTQWIAEKLIHIRYASLCNILMQKPVVTELVRRQDAHADSIVTACQSLLESHELIKQQQESFAQIRSLLNPKQFPSVAQCLTQFLSMDTTYD